MGKGSSKDQQEKAPITPENEPGLAGDPLESQSPDPQLEKPEGSTEDRFSEIRQSLKEDESERQRSGFFRRFKNRLDNTFKRKPRASRVEAPADRITLESTAQVEQPPDDTLAQVVHDQESLPAVEPPEEKVEERIEPSVVQPVDEKLTEAPPVEDKTKVEEIPPTRLTSRELLSRPPEGEASGTDYREIREVALQEYEETPATQLSEPSVSLRQKTRRAFRDMRPLEKRLLIGASVLIVLFFMVAGGFFAFNSLPKPAPTATPTAFALPYPVSISLPGGWTFPLSMGRVVGGKWNPAGPEWLEGTEVCRWVSLPYSVQLEAVLRTLKPDDQIGLTMSNYDYLVYKARSIQQVPADQISQLNSQTPCLLVILADEKSDTRWVVTSAP